MRFPTRTEIIAFAAFALLLCAASAQADTYDLTYSGANITGTLTLTVTNDGGGIYTINSITGRPFSKYGEIFLYDQLIGPGSSPSIDFYGLLLGVTGESSPANICGNCDDNNGVSYPEYAYVGSGGNSITFGSGFDDYSITLSIPHGSFPGV